MKNKISCMALLITSALYQTSVFSGSSGDLDNIQAQWSTPNSIYLALSAGGALSTDASLVVPSIFWDPSPEGYNSDVGDSEVLGASIGYVIDFFRN